MVGVLAGRDAGRHVARALVEPLPDVDARHHLLPAALVDRREQAVAQTARQREVVAHAPLVLHVELVLVGHEQARQRRALADDAAVDRVVVARRRLRHGADHVDERVGVRRLARRGHGRQARAVGRGRARAAGHVPAPDARGPRPVQRPGVERVGVGERVVAEIAQVGAELQRVVALDPRQVVGDVPGPEFAPVGGRERLVVVHEPEHVGAARLQAERHVVDLRVADTQRVDDVGAEHPVVAAGEAPVLDLARRVRRQARELLDADDGIALRVEAGEQRLGVG